MSELDYAIFNGDTPVTNLLVSRLTDLETAKRLAQEVSEGQPDATIIVRSRVTEPEGVWRTVAATFRDGQETDD
jgi:hypothetical protein